MIYRVLVTLFLSLTIVLLLLASNWKDQNSKSADLSNWERDFVVLTLFYTSCPTMCGMTLESVKKLERALKEKFPKRIFQFVLFTIDPKIDTPRHLKKFADSRKIARPNWHLISGPTIPTKKLLSRFDLGFSSKTGQEHIMHTTQIVLLRPGLREITRTDSISPDVGKVLEKVKEVISQ